MKLIIFDIDGTLLLNGDVARNAFEGAFEAVCGFAPHGERFSFAGMTDRGIFRKMLESRGEGARFDAEFGRFAEEFERRLRATYFESDKPYLLPGVSELVEALHERSDVALAVATGNMRPTAHIKLSKFGLDRYFPVGSYGGDHEGRVELFAGCLAAARPHYGVEFAAEETWVLGDTLADVEAARAVGMRVLGVETGPSDAAELQGADMVLGDFGDTDEVLGVLHLD